MSGLGCWLRREQRRCAWLEVAIAVLAREREHAARVLGRARRLATFGERFGPSQLAAGCPQRHRVGLVELAREREVPIGALVLAQHRGEQAEVQSSVSVADGRVPVDLVGPRLDETIERRGGVAVARLKCCVRIENQGCQITGCG
jgi:hypothetical protein